MVVVPWIESDLWIGAWRTFGIGLRLVSVCRVDKELGWRATGRSGNTRDP